LLNNFFRPAIFYIFTHVNALIHQQGNKYHTHQNQTECSNNSRKNSPSVIPFFGIALMNSQLITQYT
jgi:hypothetical protein